MRIIHETSIMSAPQQNEAAKRKNKALTEMDNTKYDNNFNDRLWYSL